MPKPTLPSPILMLVTGHGSVPDEELVGFVERALEGGVNMVQLRERDLPAGELFVLGTALRRALAGRALLIINDRVDVAAAVEADGVQLPESGLSVAAAGMVLGPDKLIGRSVHSEDGAKNAVENGADFLVLGTIFETTSHPDEPPLGFDLLNYLLLGHPLTSAAPAEVSGLREDVRETAPVPLIGIGGINPDNAAQVMSTGAAGIAVQSAIMQARDPRAAAQALRAAMGR